MSEYKLPLDKRIIPVIIGLLVKGLLLGMLVLHPVLRFKDNYLFLVFGLVLGLPLGFLKFQEYIALVSKSDGWGVSANTILIWVYRGLLWVLTFLLLYFGIYMPEIFPIPFYFLVLLMITVWVGLLICSDFLQLLWFLFIKE
jgi:hypothetical protein